jgi:PAS domain S-box-containing protein
MAMFTALIFNAALLLAMVLILDLARDDADGTARPLPAPLAGAILGVIAIGAMLAAYRASPGLIFDTRSVLFGASGLFFGPVPTLVATVIAGGYRLSLGGPGAIAGIASIVISGAIGILWSKWRRGPLANIGWRELLALGLTIHVVLLGMFAVLLPSSTMTVTGVALPFLTLYPLATVAIGMLIANRLGHERTRAALAASEHRYRTLFDSSITPLVVMNPADGRFIDCNPAAITAYRMRDRDAVLGLTPLDVSASRQPDGEDSAAAATRHIADCVRDGLAIFDWRHRRPDGEVWDAEVRLMKFRQDERDLVQFSLTDITELRRGEEARRTLMQAIEQAPASIVITDVDANIEYVNPAFSRVTGYDLDEVRGKNPRILQSGQTPPERHVELWNTITSGRTWSGVLHNKRKDGSLYWEQAYIGPVCDERGRISHFVAVKENITERMLAEEELVRARDAAEGATRAKSAFLATMSHEIRTPLTGVLGMAQLLLLDEVSESERRDYARTILNSGNSLLTLLNDILDLSKVESGRIELAAAPYAPGQLLEEVADLFGQAAENKGLALVVDAVDADDIDRRYIGDPSRLRQMLSNYVSNAIKFSSAGAVHLAVRRIAHPDGDVLRFSVRDEGIGIPPEQLELLFRPFVQLDSSSARAYGGSGLGLSIVRNVAEVMDGSAGCDSVPGAGSTFWFEVPAQALPAGVEARAAPRRPADAGPAAAWRPRRVLLAEDNAVNRKVVELMLRKQGIEVISAEDGAAALAQLQSDAAPPDLVLMDCQMPVLDGFETTRRIRAWQAAEGRAYLPIIALTANAFEEDRQRCLAAGMDDFITKPLNLPRLLAAFENLHRDGPPGSAKSPPPV